MDPTTVTTTAPTFLAIMREWQIVILFTLNLIALMVAFISGLRVLLAIRDSVRDFTRDMTTTMGAVHPPSGLLGDVAILKSESKQYDRQLTELFAIHGRRSTDRAAERRATDS